MLPLGRLRNAGLLVLLCPIALLFGSCRHSGPVYTMEQTDSTHAGYRRTTLTSGSTVYENDFAEAPLLSVNTAPSQIVGKLDNSGEGEKVYLYAIPGQNPRDYVILGGEMYPLGVYRNSKTPPFDWRAAKFRQMEFAAPEGPAAHKRTTDPALIEEVLNVLRESKAAATIPADAATNDKNFFGIYLWSDQLPGIMYSPHVYFDKSGQVYLGFWNPTSPEWSPAGPLFSAWVKTK